MCHGHFLYSSSYNVPRSLPLQFILQCATVTSFTVHLTMCHGHFHYSSSYNLPRSLPSHFILNVPRSLPLQFILQCARSLPLQFTLQCATVTSFTVYLTMCHSHFLHSSFKMCHDHSLHILSYNMPALSLYTSYQKEPHGRCPQTQTLSLLSRTTMELLSKRTNMKSVSFPQNSANVFPAEQCAYCVCCIVTNKHCYVCMQH